MIPLKRERQRPMSNSFAVFAHWSVRHNLNNVSSVQFSYVAVHVPWRCCGIDGPVIRCRTATAYSGDKNVRLTCEVRARPGLTALFWLIDVNGTAVTEGVVIDEYWSLNMVSNRS